MEPNFSIVPCQVTRDNRECKNIDQPEKTQGFAGLMMASTDRRKGRHKLGKLPYCPNMTAAESNLGCHSLNSTMERYWLMLNQRHLLLQISRGEPVNECIMAASVSAANCSY
jgi:hypothetical protein